MTTLPPRQKSTSIDTVSGGRSWISLDDDHDWNNIAPFAGGQRFANRSVESFGSMMGSSIGTVSLWHSYGGQAPVMVHRLMQGTLAAVEEALGSVTVDSARRRYTWHRMVGSSPVEVGPGVEFASLYADAFREVLGRVVPVTLGTYSVEGQVIHYLEIEVPAELYDAPDQLLMTEEIVLAAVVDLKPDAAGAFALRYRPV